MKNYLKIHCKFESTCQFRYFPPCNFERASAASATLPTGVDMQGGKANLPLLDGYSTCVRTKAIGGRGAACTLLGTQLLKGDTFTYPCTVVHVYPGQPEFRIPFHLETRRGLHSGMPTVLKCSHKDASGTGYLPVVCWKTTDEVFLQYLQ
eukprot:1736116-Rhodomonas_salina.1